MVLHSCSVSKEEEELFSTSGSSHVSLHVHTCKLLVELACIVDVYFQSRSKVSLAESKQNRSSSYLSLLVAAWSIKPCFDLIVCKCFVKAKYNTTFLKVNVVPI